MTAEESAIRNQLDRINHAWQRLRGEAMTAELSACFAEDVVMRGAEFAFLGKGREFAVQSYHDFISQAAVKAFRIEEPAIDISGQTATANYKWQMTYILHGQEYTQQGHDLFVLSRRDNRWLVIWRALLSS